MDTGFLLDDYSRVILLVAFSYAFLRIARFGLEAFDRRVLTIAGCLPVLAVAIYYFSRSSEFLTAAFVAAVLWLVAALGLSSRPGFRVRLPEGRRRTALMLEFAVAAALTVLMINLGG